MMRHLLTLLILLLSGTGIGRACTLCDPANLNRQTLRQEARACKIVVVGTLTNARLVGERGYTDLQIDEVIKNDPAMDRKKPITLPRWIPLDPKKPTRVLVFIDIIEGKFDPFRGVPLKGKDLGAHVRGALEIDEKDRSRLLKYFFDKLDSPDPDVAADAFLELAKASDAEIGALAPKLEPGKLRKLIGDPETPVDRLGLFAYLLGACGTRSDGDLLSKMLSRTDDRTSAALSGLLGGLIEMRPDDGWKLAYTMIADKQRPFNDKMAILSTLRFYQAYKPAEHRKSILAGMAAIVARGDMADMAIEDLRRWKWWDLSRKILENYGTPTHSAPLVRNAIIRYALCAPDAESKAFIKDLRAKAPELVTDVEESIAFERDNPIKPKP